MHSLGHVQHPHCFDVFKSDSIFTVAALLLSEMHGGLENFNLRFTFCFLLHLD